MEKVIGLVKVNNIEQASGRGKQQAQINKIIKFATDNGWELGHIMDYEWTTKGRHEFGSMMLELLDECIALGATKVVATDVSRITRDFERFNLLVSLFELFNVDLVFTDGNPLFQKVGGYLYVK